MFKLSEAIRTALTEHGKAISPEKLDRFNSGSIAHKVYIALRDGPSPDIVCDGIRDPYLSDGEADFVIQQIAKMIAENTL